MPLIQHHLRRCHYYHQRHCRHYHRVVSLCTRVVLGHSSRVIGSSSCMIVLHKILASCCILPAARRNPPPTCRQHFHSLDLRKLLRQRPICLEKLLPHKFWLKLANLDFLGGGLQPKYLPTARFCNYRQNIHRKLERPHPEEQLRTHMAPPNQPDTAGTRRTIDRHVLYGSRRHEQHEK